jgi:hypothetical protein
MALGKHRKTEMKGDTSRWGKREESKRVSKKVRRANDRVEVSKAPPIEEVMAEKRLADSEEHENSDS